MRSIYFCLFLCTISFNFAYGFPKPIAQEFGNLDFDTEDEEGQDTGVDLEIPAEGVDEEDNENEVNGEDAGDEDTIVIEAASCGELLQACKESSDVLSCSTYNENCQEDNLEGSPDEQAIFCSLFGENC